MIQLQITNPELQDIFETRFQSNKEKFTDFIVTFLKENKKAIDNYIEKKNQKHLRYKKLDPMQNYYTIKANNDEEEITNPFEHVKDSVAFAKKLRKKSYR